MIVLWIILGLLALPVVLLAVPVKYSVDSENTNVTVRVTYLLRLVRCTFEYREGTAKTDLRVLFFEIGKKKSKKKQKKQPVMKGDYKKPEKEPPKIKQVLPKKPAKSLTYAQGKTIIKLVVPVIKKILRRIKPKYIDISGTIGFPCPADTGLFFAAYESVAGIMGLRNKIRLAGEFNTDITIVKISAKIRGKINMLRITLPMLGLLLKKPIRKLIF